MPFGSLAGCQLKVGSGSTPVAPGAGDVSAEADGGVRSIVHTASGGVGSSGGAATLNVKLLMPSGSGTIGFGFSQGSWKAAPPWALSSVQTRAAPGSSVAIIRLSWVAFVNAGGLVSNVVRSTSRMRPVAVDPTPPATYLPNGSEIRRPPG